MAGDNRDPQKVLREAWEDFQAQRYADALEKHVWIHEHALENNPAFYGVRLSFALSGWAELAEKYPPALDTLRAVRDEAARVVRDGQVTKTSRRAYHDFVAINRVLHQNEQTEQLFIWLDEHNPELAKQVFDLAESALVKAQEYSVCGKYVDPSTDVPLMLKAYCAGKEIALDPQMIGHLDFVDESFIGAATTLVALLVINDRIGEADWVVEQVLQEQDDPEFRQRLDEALAGKVPDPWP